MSLSRPRAANEITAYAHCRQCVMERPPNQSMQQYMKIEAGFKADGRTLQIWCQRHDREIACFTVTDGPKFTRSFEPHEGAIQ